MPLFSCLSVSVFKHFVTSIETMCELPYYNFYGNKENIADANKAQIRLFPFL